MKSVGSRWKAIGLTRSALLGCVAAAAMLLASLGPASAAPTGADPTPTPPTAARVARDTSEQLERQFQRAQSALALEQKGLDRASNTVATIQARIDDLKAQGQDTSKLDAALASFKTAVASAQTSFDSARAILDARAGFNPGGKVTDVTQARNTVDTARAALLQFHQTMSQARRELVAVTRPAWLGYRLLLEQANLSRLQKRLDRATQAITTYQNAIDTQKSNGKDTAKLEAALSAFKSALASAQGSHNSARSILDARAGFDASGNVTDVDAAKNTLDTARQAMREARAALATPFKNLGQAMRDFRAANRKQP